MAGENARWDLPDPDWISAAKSCWLFYGLGEEVVEDASVLALYVSLPHSAGHDSPVLVSKWIHFFVLR